MRGTHHVAFIGIGANLDRPVEHVCRAIEDLGETPHSRILGYSGIYRSAPMGPPDQPDYVNAVAKLQTRLGPDELLSFLQGIERQHGRVRTPERWGPRPLDLDLLLYGRSVVDTPALTVPHPGMHQRPFVLYPLLELEPGLSVPGHGTLASLVERCPAGGIARLNVDCHERAEGDYA